MTNPRDGIVTASDGAEAFLDEGWALFETERLNDPKELPQKKLLKECTYETLTPSMRLFFEVDDQWGRQRSGFHAVIAETVSHSGRYDDEWADPTLVINVVVRLWAAFDGVRHLYFGTDGYLHYPDMVAIAAGFKRLSELEEQYCSID